MSRSGRSDGEGPDEPDTGSRPVDDDDTYEIGYRKPPRHSRFGPGNKMGRGRRRGSKNIGAIFNEAASAKVATKVNGKVKKITKRDAALQQLVNLAAKGELKAITKVIELDERYGPQDDPDGLTAEEQQRDLAALEDYLSMRLASWEGDDDQS